MPYEFPEKTKITMLDMVTNKYYYYVVTADDVTNHKYIYGLSDFIEMGSEDAKFNEQEACDTYYNAEQDLIYENYIFHINFADTNITQTMVNNSLLMELRDTEQQTLVGVLGIQRDIMKYTVYTDKNATIELNVTEEPETVYIGNTFNLNVETDFTQKVENSKTVYDTQYFDNKLGIKISFYDSNGNRVNNDSLLGINFELDGKLYYPRIDGTTRICIADKVTNVLAKIKVHTEDNTTLASGDYRIQVESFGSADGIYYGLEASDVASVNVKIINAAYGLKVITNDESKIVNKETGQTEDNKKNVRSVIEYSSKFTKPSISVSLYRRDYDEVFSQTYTLVDLQDYVENGLVPTSKTKEYDVTKSPQATTTFTLTLKPNLVTGTYKLVYKLYDNDTYVGEDYEYIVIK